LVAKLGRRETAVRLRIDGRAQQVEEIARRLVQRRGHSLKYDRIHQLDPARSEPAASEVAQGRDPSRKNHVEEMWAREVDSELADHAPERSAMPPHLEGEHGTAGDFERQELHGSQQIDFGPTRVCESLDRLRSSGDDMAAQ